MKKVILGVSGASCIDLANAFIKYMPEDISLEIIASKNANLVASKELREFDIKDISSFPASGSYEFNALAIIPTSMNTLAKISVGISDNLLTRAAAVAIKERRDLLLAPRELPFSAICLENMLKLSKLGVMIAPPVLGYYSNPKNLEDMQKFIVGKWYDLLKIKHNLYKRWGMNEE